MDVSDEDSLELVLAHMDNALQYGEGLEPKAPAEDDEGGEGGEGGSSQQKRHGDDEGAGGVLNASLGSFGPKQTYSEDGEFG